MAAARDMAGDLHVVGLIGQDQARGNVVFHQFSNDRRFGRIAANEAMRAELKNVADHGDRRVPFFRRERPPLDRRRILTKNDLIDLIERDGRATVAVVPGGLPCSRC